MIRNIIFDWSGTLVDDLPAVLQATNHVFEQAGGREWSLEEFRAEFRLPFTEFYDEHLADVPMPQLEEWFHAKFREAQDSVVALPYAEAFLQFVLDAEIKTLLLSTIHHEHFLIQTGKVGFSEYIQHPYTNVWDKKTRIHEILAEHGLLPNETMFIGDMQHDIDTAKHADVISCAVLTGYNRLEQLRASEPDLIVENLGELQALLTANRFEWPFETSLCSGSLQEIPISTVGALISDGAGKVLMIQTRKWSDLWGIPGGKIRYNEPSIDALRREISEETALNVNEIQFVMVQDCIQSNEFYRPAHFLLLNYVCQATSRDVTLNDEAFNYRWVSMDEAMKMPLNEPTRRLIDEVVHQEMNV